MSQVRTTPPTASAPRSLGRVARRLTPLLAPLLCLALGCGQPPQSEEVPPPAVVKWEVASSNVPEEWTELIGTTMPLPDRIARISAPVEGRVVSVLTGTDGRPVVEGQQVEKGAVLVRLDDTVAKANLARTQAAHEMLLEDHRQAQLAVDLAALEAERLRKLEEEDRRVRDTGFKGQPLVTALEIKRADIALEQAQSKVRAEKNKIAAGEKELEALREQLQLYTLAAPIRGRVGRMLVVPGQTLAVGAPVAEVIDLDDQLDVLCFVPPSMVGRLKAGFKLTDKSLESLAAAGVPEAVRSKLKAFKAQKEEQEKEQREAVYATHDQFLSELASALTKDELERYRDLILTNARAGQSARTGAADRDPSAPAEVEAEGQIEYIAEQGEPETGNFAVKVRFSNKDARLRANRVLRLRVLTKPGRECLTIPEAAVQEDEDPPTVVVVSDIKTAKNKEGKEETTGVAHRVQAELGVRDRVLHRVEILRLTDPEKDPAKKWGGEVRDAQIVVEGAQGVQSGDPVKLDTGDD